MEKDTKYFTVGDKVVPEKKTLGPVRDLPRCSEWKKARAKKQPFLYVRQIHPGPLDEHFVILAADENSVGGNFYKESDFRLYEDPNETKRPDGYKPALARRYCRDCIHYALHTRTGLSYCHAVKPIFEVDAKGVCNLFELKKAGGGQ